jgi:tetratricopeptide (TPR) repeat protein
VGDIIKDFTVLSQRMEHIAFENITVRRNYNRNDLHSKCFLSFLKMLFLIILLSAPFLIIAQDNFEQIEKNLPAMADDTAKVNRLVELGEHYCSVKNDKALMFLQEAYTISLSLNYTSGIGRSLMWQGRVYYYESNFNLSTNYLDKAKKPLEAAGDPDDLSFWYMAKGFNLKITGDYVHAIEMLEKSIQLSKQAGNKSRVATCSYSIGEVLRERGDIDKAMDYYQEALTIEKEIDDKVGIANVYSCLGYSYTSLRKLDSSLYFHKRALKLRTELKLDRHIASSEMNIGKVLIRMGRYDEAIKTLKHALSIFESLDEKTGSIVVNLLIADAMNKKGDPQGVELANKMLQMAKSIDNPHFLSFAYEQLSEIYAYRNDYQKAFEYQKKHKVIDDSLFTIEKERMLTEVEAKFQSEKKDDNIRYLTAQTKSQRKNNILLIILIVLFGASVVLLFFLLKMKSTAFRHQQKLREQENIIHSQEKKLLKEQLESKNRELASKALEMLRYNDAISGIVEKLEKMNYMLKDDPDALKSINDIIRDIDSNTRQNIWDEFETAFKNIHSGFYKKLIEICPDITSSEIKLAALLKLNLTSKEISAITYKSESGIKTTRYRLRKKLNFSSDEKLIPFLMQL